MIIIRVLCLHHCSCYCNFILQHALWLIYSISFFRCHNPGECLGLNAFKDKPWKCTLTFEHIDKAFEHLIFPIWSLDEYFQFYKDCTSLKYLRRMHFKRFDVSYRFSYKCEGTGCPTHHVISRE